MIETRGFFDVNQVLPDGSIHCAGWVAALSSASKEAPVDIDVGFGPNGYTPAAALPQASMRKARAKSPDVQAAHPELIGADNARFYVTIAPQANGTPVASDCLIWITPVFSSGARGVPMANLLAPRIPLPPNDAVLSVGGGMDIAYRVFVDLVMRAGLSQKHSVLDVGCGIGRMAYPLAYYLDSDGRYSGFDIMSDAIAWAKQSVGARFSNFDFAHVDITNERYNPRGRFRSDKFVFPYKNGVFDRLFLNSVFTHMLDYEIQHYLDEFSRVMKPGAIAYITCFMHDDDVTALIRAGKSKENQIYPCGAGFVIDQKVPEASIGFPRVWMMDNITSRGFVVEKVLPGSWCGRQDCVGHQDIILARRK